MANPQIFSAHFKHTFLGVQLPAERDKDGVIVLPAPIIVSPVLAVRAEGAGMMT